ncbi:YHS domain-containing (seleno)protein [Labrenzia sp. PHM005]|uniref:YHS domain-containing (seleno)protein n=1 Tax=Stappiaceae TaxID=2821832 RepID=UPI00114090A0|nr:YHS domain-containing (seleno)protein [Labrenzia sp. PHM005]QDG75763.1 twin-arginine translocation pathway signal protein [Labrenzia sp. PHM005]
MCLSAILLMVVCLWNVEGMARPQRFVPDPITGYAIGGHDPVSYFVDGYPRKGSREHTYAWGGTEWVFVNKGNLEAFKLHPNAYAPMFAACGGYGLSEGFATAGNPFIYAVIEGRLMFFYSVVNRFLFIVSSTQRLNEARENAAKVGCTPG